METKDSVTQLRSYYQSDKFLSELRLPARPNFHHFRLELFSSERAFMRVHDVVRKKEQFQKILLRFLPKNVFFSPVEWLDPVNVRKTKTMNDYMLSSPLYFDVDVNVMDENRLNDAIINTNRLIDFIDEKYGRKPDWIVFSGKRGFHIYYWQWDEIPKKYGRAKERINEFIKSRKEIISKIERQEIVVDTKITIDPWRILRVPGTIHADTGLITKSITDLAGFTLEKARIQNSKVSISHNSL